MRLSKTINEGIIRNLTFVIGFDGKLKRRKTATKKTSKMRRKRTEPSNFTGLQL